MIKGQKSIADTLTNVIPNKMELINLSPSGTKVVIYLDEYPSMLEEFVCRIEMRDGLKTLNAYVNRDAMIQAMKTAPLEAFNAVENVYNMDTGKTEQRKLGEV